MGKRTHSRGRDPELEIRNQSGFKYGVDIEYGTHLTINRSTNVINDFSKYHQQKTSHASEGVNLLNEQINLRLR